MQLHQLKPIHPGKKKKRVGRGGKHGTYSGKGIKGQKSRSGHNLKPIIRELIKKYPKLRGYRQKSNLKSQKSKIIALNLETLEKRFKNREIVSPQILIEKGIICKIKGKVPKVKILGKGKLTKPLTIENCYVSRAAKEMIEKAGGVIKSKIQNPNDKSMSND